MIRFSVTRESARHAALTLSAILLVGSVAIACGSAAASQSQPPVRPSASPAATTVATGGASASASASGSATPSASGSGAGGASPSPTSSDNTPTVGIHFDLDLEAMLPAQLGGVQPTVMSVPLSSYLDSASGEDKALYQAWLSRLGAKAENATLAAAVGGGGDQQYTILALRVPGASQDDSFTAFRGALTTQKWSFVDKLIATKVVTEATDPVTGTVGDVYVKGGVVFIVLAKDPALVTEAMIRLP